MPVFRAKSEDVRILHGTPGSVSRWAGSYPIVANAGMFNMDTGAVVGALVADSKVVNRYPTTWPLFLISSGKASIVKGGGWKEYWDLDNARQAVSCAPLLVWDGKPTDISKEHANSNMSVSATRPNDRTGRTAVGVGKDGNVILVVEEAKTMKELQDILIAAGSVAAINLDGGGSTVLYRDGKRVLGSDVRKYPSAIAFAKVVNEVAKKPVVCIDPGHGGRDPEIVADGLRGADVNLAVGNLVGSMLKNSGVEVVMTRKTDVHLGVNEQEDLAERVRIANNAKADYFVSIHCNSADSTSAKGTETYVIKKGFKAEELATKIQRNLVALGQADRGVKEANYYVLKYTDMPAVLVEMGFLTNVDDRKKLTDPTWQKRFAVAIANGVLEQFGLTLVENETPPPQEQPDYRILYEQEKARADKAEMKYQQLVSELVRIMEVYL